MKKRDENLLIEKERRQRARKTAKWKRFGSILKQFSTGCFIITVPALAMLLWIAFGKDSLLPLAIAALIVVWLNK
jgi:uncharacterized membrane protein